MRNEDHRLPMFFLFQSDELLQYFLSNWLDASTLGILDSAITSRTTRSRWLSVLSTIQTNVFDNWSFNDASIRWLVLRDISVPKIQIDGKNKLHMRDNAIRGMSTRSLKSLDLSNCLRITDKGLSSLLHGCRGLINIDLRGCNITDYGVSSIAHECSKLESIRLNFWKVTDASIAALSHRCRELLSIDLMGCDITSVSLAALGDQSFNLRNISLNFCRITDIGVLLLSRGCRTIQNVDFTGCSLLTDDGVTSLSENCFELLSIRLSSCAVTDTSLYALSLGCHKLETINLSFCSDLTDDGITALAVGCRTLKSITLESCVLLTDKSVTAITKHCPTLRSINLDCCDRLTDISLLAISQRCYFLESVSLRGCFVTDLGALALSTGCPNLEFVDLDSCTLLTHTGVSELAQNCPKLDYIYLGGCVRELDDCLIAIPAAGCQRLRVMTQNGCVLLGTNGVESLVLEGSTVRAIDYMYCYQVSESVRKELRSKGISVTNIDMKNPNDFFNYLNLESSITNVLNN